MRIAAFFDAQRLHDGGAALARLTVALLDQGVFLTRLVPDDFDPLGADPHERSIALLPRIDYPAHVPPWLRSVRVDRIIDQLTRDVPDLVLACGLSTWSMARQCSEAMECPLVLELASDAEVERGSDPGISKAAAGLMRLAVAPAQGAQSAMTAPSSSTIAGAPVRITLRPGVAQGGSQSLRAQGAVPFEQASRPSAPSIALVGGCASLEWWAPALEALRDLESSAPGWSGVVELRGPKEHEVWRLLRELKLQERVATIASAAALGPLVRRCDAMMVVEPLDRLSIPLLEAMAAEVAIAAIASDWLPLIDGQTGIVLRAAGRTGALVSQGSHRPASSGEWRTALESIAVDRGSGMVLGRQAAEYIGREHRTSIQAQAMAAWFEELAGAPALPFPHRMGTA